MDIEVVETESILEWLQGGRDVLSEHENADACLSWLSGRPLVDRHHRAPVEAVSVVRKNAFSLSTAETDAIVNALTALSRTDIWYRYAQAHDQVSFGANSVHGMFRQNELGTPSGTHDAYHRFLPWHRLFLWDFEAQMRAQSANAFIPYWDWTIASQRRLPPWIDRVPLSLVRTGSSSPFAVTRDVTTRTSIVAPSDSRLPRRALISDLMTSNSGIDPRTGATVTTDNYDKFTAVLERLHGAPHVWVGGTMAGTLSPGDFVFFMHHAQIDRLWRTWQARFPGQRPSLTGSAANLQRVSGATARFDTVLDATAVGFDYDSAWS